MWLATTKAMTRIRSESPYELHVEVVNDWLTIRVDTTGRDGKPVDGLTVPVSITTPSGEVQTMLSQTAPGIYEGRVPARESGGYIARVKPLQNGNKLPPLIG